MSFTGNDYKSRKYKSDKRVSFKYVSETPHNKVFSTFTYVTNFSYKNVENLKNKNHKELYSVWQLDLTRNSYDKVYRSNEVKIGWFKKLFINDPLFSNVAYDKESDKYLEEISFFLQEINNKNLLFNYIIANIKQFILDENPSIIIIKIPNIGKNDSLTNCLRKIKTKNILLGNLKNTDIIFETI